MYDGCRTHRYGPLSTTCWPVSTSTVVRNDLPSTTIAQLRTARPVHMTSRPATLSPVDPNCQAAAFFSPPVSIPAATTAAVMMMMFSQSVPWSRAVLPSAGAAPDPDWFLPTIVEIVGFVGAVPGEALDAADASAVTGDTDTPRKTVMRMSLDVEANGRETMLRQVGSGSVGHFAAQCLRVWSRDNGRAAPDPGSAGITGWR